MSARGTSWRYLAILSLTACLQTGTAWHAPAQDAASDRDAFILGTASTGGTYHPVGVALSTLVKLRLLPDFDVDLTAINTDGSHHNIELLRSDDIQFAIISALAGYDARTGTGRFADAGGDSTLRAVTTLWLSTDHLLVRDDAVESGTIDDFLGLEGGKVSLGREGSGTLQENRSLLSALGMDVDVDFERVELGYAESAEALAAGRIDGMSVSGGVPIGAVQDVFDNLGDEAALLEISDEQLALIDGGRALWQRVVIPSGTYPGQNRDIYTIGMPNILAVRADVDEEVVYQITKTIFEELDYLHGLHPTTRQIGLDNAANILPIPMHEGAARYFREMGIEPPPPPIELDPDLLARYPSVEEARADANQGVVSIFTGTEGDTSTRVAAELATVLGDADVRLLSTSGGGIGRNLTDLLYLKGVDTALVRADVLHYAREQNVYPAVQNQVNYISEMFPEEVHLLVTGEIDDLSDLTGKKINLGAPGSGSDITASIVLSQLGVSAEPTRFQPRMAIEKLKRGEIAGAFFVGGKPMPLLRQIGGESGLKLISLPALQYADSYRSAEIHGRDYPGLMRADGVLSTIAVRTALLTYAWRPQSARYQALDDLTNALFRNLLTLQDDGYHPKWREIDPTADFAAWQRFGPAARWIDDNQGTARRIAEQGRLRLERQATNQVGSGGGQPPLIETDADPASAPEEVEAPAPQVVVPTAEIAPKPQPSETPQATPRSQPSEETPDAAALPPGETASTPEPTGTQPASAGSESVGSSGPMSNRVYQALPSSDLATPPRSLSSAPTAGASHAPTF